MSFLEKWYLDMVKGIVRTVADPVVSAVLSKFVKEEHGSLQVRIPEWAHSWMVTQYTTHRLCMNGFVDELAQFFDKGSFYHHYGILEVESMEGRRAFVVVQIWSSGDVEAILYDTLEECHSRGRAAGVVQGRCGQRGVAGVSRGDVRRPG